MAEVGQRGPLFTAIVDFRCRKTVNSAIESDGVRHKLRRGLVYMEMGILMRQCFF